jgi:hypothetical protein
VNILWNSVSGHFGVDLEEYGRAKVYVLKAKNDSLVISVVRRK